MLDIDVVIVDVRLVMQFLTQVSKQSSKVVRTSRGSRLGCGMSYLLDLGMRDVGLHTLGVQGGAIDTDAGQHFVLPYRSEKSGGRRIEDGLGGSGERWEMGETRDDDGGEGDRKGKSRAEASAG